ncbi:uncharacterized protein LOC124117558 [Haliotis rufescens]|uniref:uncharacterized protein LOC124117558 n=1 Tax=Haliotis rufescens TaxID=6454 RepID=UPI00201FA0A0|nr:uncharacterized protein LOC124117558 [Haliotis rufescens]
MESKQTRRRSTRLETGLHRQVLKKLESSLASQDIIKKFVQDFSKKPLSELMPKTKGYANYLQPFELHTDASTRGLGAVIYQTHEGHQQVIAYASRSLNKSERNYSAHKLEFLCLKWAVTEKFHDYLYGHDFTVLTDNNPMTWVLTSAKLGATGHRWLAALSAYNFTISYRPWKNNADAHVLSRLQTPEDQSNMRQISSHSINAICNMTSTLSLVESVSVSSAIIQEQEVEISDEKCDANVHDWRRAQARDPALDTVMAHLRNGTKTRPIDCRADPEMCGLMKNFSSFKLRRGVLYRVISVDGETCEQLVLPSRCHQSVLHWLHDQVGHPGHDLIQDRFFWPGMTKDIENIVSQCERWIRRKSSTTVKAPLRIHSDQGANFQGKLMKELCSLTQINKSRTTPHHAMGNGQCERFNRTLLNMLGTLDAIGKKDWKSHVGPLVHAYNCTRHETTGYSPFFLMYGRHPRLPVDLAFGLEIDPSKAKSLSKFTKSLRDRLKQAYELAAEAADKSQTRQKTNYDAKARAAMLDVGDRVLVKIVTFDGKHKIADKWEKDVYVILKQPDPVIPVFVDVTENLCQDKEEDSDVDICIGPVTSSEPSVSAGVPADGPPEVETEVVTDVALNEDHRLDDLQRARDDVDVTVGTPDDVVVSAQENVQIETEAPGTPIPSVDLLLEDVDTSAQEDVQTEADTPEPPPTVTTRDDRPRRRMLPTPPLRRSQRERMKPHWQTSWKYVMATTTTPKPDWKSRADYLSSLIATRVVASRCDQASEALVNLVTGKLR